MKYFQNLYALLLGAFYTRVKGGRIKRFITFLVSVLVIVGSIWLMYRWSFIHKSKHIIYLSHPVAVDTARNHYMKVDLCIRSAEGYTMKKDKEEDHYVYAHSISTTQQHRIKDPGLLCHHLMTSAVLTTILTTVLLLIETLCHQKKFQ